jgi:hypothetical protein
MEVGSGAPAASPSPDMSALWRRVMSAEATAALEEGIRLCFNRWTALQLAVENEWGGRSSRQKVQKLQADVLTFFVHSRGESSHSYGNPFRTAMCTACRRI